MTSGDALPPAHVESVRRYLTALLPPEAADAALHETLGNARYWRDTELADVLRHAHTALRARAEVPAPTAAAVLVVEAGIDVVTASEVVGVPAEVATEMVEMYRHGSTDAPEVDGAGPGGDRATHDETAGPVTAPRTEPLASPTGDPIDAPTPTWPRRHLPRGRGDDRPPEVIGRELRRHLRQDDLDRHRYSRRVRLTLVGAALGVFLVFLATVVAGGLTP